MVAEMGRSVTEAALQIEFLNFLGYVSKSVECLHGGSVPIVDGRAPVVA